MTKEYNSMYFSNEEVKKGMHLSLLDTLYKISLASNDTILHIHTYTEEDAVIVEWCQHNPEFEDYDQNTFSYIGCDEYIMFAGEMPDKHYEYFHSKDEYQEALNEWLKEHPNYKQNRFGHWYDENEYNNVQETLAKVESETNNEQ